MSLAYPISGGGRGYQQITTALSAATGLTVPAGASQAYVTVEMAAVRWRGDGVDPTTSVGMPLAAGDSMVLNGNLTKVKFIAVSGSPVLNVVYS